MASPTQPVALPFIVERDGKLVLGEGADLIEELDADEVATISIVGKYRTGKSYLLSLIAAGSAGSLAGGDDRPLFNVGGTVDAVTRGIWVLPGGMRVNPSTGKKQAVLLMDSEGLGNTGSDQDHDARLFSLSMMLSSYLIFNTVGALDDQSISDISFICSLTNFLHVRKRSDTDVEEETGEGLADFAPSLLWLVRDFALKLQSADEKPIAPQEYLEAALAEKPGHHPDVLAKNKVTYAVKSIFKDRDCAVLVRPAAEENVLQKLFSFKKEVRPEFLAEIDKLRARILSRAKPKMMGSTAITPKTLITLAREFVDSVNSKRVPTIGDAWTAVQSIENKAVSQAAADEFIADLEHAIAGKKLPLETTELLQLHKEAKKRAVALFDSKAVGQGLEKDAARKELKFRIADEFARINALNEKASEDSCKACIRTLYGEHVQATVTSMKSLEEYEEAWATLRNKYMQDPRAKGPAALAVLGEFMESKVLPTMKVFILQSRSREEKSKSDIIGQRSAAETETSKTRLELAQSLAAAKMEIDEAKQAAAAALGQKQVLEEQFKLVNAQLQVVQNDLIKAHTQAADMKKRFADQLTELNTRLMSAETGRNAVSLELDQARLQLEQLGALTQSQSASAELQKSQYESERDLLIEAVRNLGGDPEATLKGAGPGLTTPRAAKAAGRLMTPRGSSSVTKSASRASRIGEEVDVTPSKLKDALADASREFAALKKEKTALDKLIILKDKSLLKLTDALDKAREEIEVLTKRVREKEGETRTHVADKKQLAAELHRNEVVIDQTSKEVSRLSELHQLKEEIRALSSRAENEASFKSKELENMQREVRGMQKVLADRERDVLKLQDELEAAQNRIKALEINPSAVMPSSPSKMLAQQTAVKTPRTPR